MTRLEQPLLLMFLGSPGSGKTYFARNIADKLGIVRINGDSMRLSIFGSLEEMDRIRESAERPKLNEYTFRALDYVAEQIMMRGLSVVYDAHTNKQIDRKNLGDMARKYNVSPVVVQIKTSHDVALKRGLTRDEQIDQRKMATEEKMREVMARHQVAADGIADGELVITLSGEIPFEEQFVAFQKQLRAAL